jgi:hypothetical protein
MSHFLGSSDLSKLPSDLVRLKGQDNFVRWKRDLRVVALSEGVLDIIEGREPILSPPREDEYLYITNTSSVPPSTPTVAPLSTEIPVDDLMLKEEDAIPSMPSGLHPTAEMYSQFTKPMLETMLQARLIDYPKKDNGTAVGEKIDLANLLVRWDNDRGNFQQPPVTTAPAVPPTPPFVSTGETLSDRIARFRLKSEQYERNSAKVRRATAILIYYCDTTIRGNLETFTTPNAIWQYLHLRYKMADTRVEAMAQDKIDRLRLKDCSGVQDYLNKLEMYRQDIRDVGGDTYSDRQMIPKIKRGLTEPAYKPFKDQHDYLSDLPGFPTASFDQFTSQLLTYESKLSEHNHSFNNTTNTDSTPPNPPATTPAANNTTTTKPPRVKTCFTKGCRVWWTHPTEKCWKAHPEQRPPPKTGDNSNSGGNTATAQGAPRKFIAMVTVERQDPTAVQPCHMITLDQLDAADDSDEDDILPLPKAQIHMMESHNNGEGTDEPSTPKNKSFKGYMKRHQPSLLRIAQRRGLMVKKADKKSVLSEALMENDQCRDTSSQPSNHSPSTSSDTPGPIASQTPCPPGRNDATLASIPEASATPPTLPPIQAGRPLPGSQDFTPYTVTSSSPPNAQILPPRFPLTQTPSSHDYGTPITLGHLLTPIARHGTPAGISAQRRIESSLGLQLLIDTEGRAGPEGGATQAVDLDALDLRASHRTVLHAVDYVNIVYDTPGYRSSFRDYLRVVERTEQRIALIPPTPDTPDDGGLFERCLVMALSVSGDAAQDSTVMHTARPGQDEWILDSGANTHLATRAHWFRELRPTTEEANGPSSPISIQGQGVIDMLLSDSDAMVSLVDTLFAAEARVNILSLSKLGKAGMYGTWDDKEITIRDKTDNSLLATAVERNGLYYLRDVAKAGAHAYGSLATCREGSSSQLNHVTILNVARKMVIRAHRRMGHLSFYELRKLLGHADGLKFADKDVAKLLGAICPVCALAKPIIHTPRAPASRKFDKPGQMLVCDIWGPHNNPVGWDGTSCLLFLSDIAISWTSVARMLGVYQAFRAFKVAHKMIQRANGTATLHIRMDNIYNTHEFRNYCEKHGIGYEFSAAYGPHQVGSSERGHRTMRERSASMWQDHMLPGDPEDWFENYGKGHFHDHLPSSLWVELACHAVWIKNRSPAASLEEHVTPWQAKYKVKPDLSQERVWGSPAYAITPLGVRSGSKLLEPRSKVGYFVGMENETTHRIYNPDTGKVERKWATIVDDGCEDEEELGAPIEEGQASETPDDSQEQQPPPPTLYEDESDHDELYDDPEAPIPKADNPFTGPEPVGPRQERRPRDPDSSNEASEQEISPSPKEPVKSKFFQTGKSAQPPIVLMTTLFIPETDDEDSDFEDDNEQVNVTTARHRTTPKTFPRTTRRRRFSPNSPPTHRTETVEVEYIDSDSGSEYTPSPSPLNKTASSTTLSNPDLQGHMQRIRNESIASTTISLDPLIQQSVDYTLHPQYDEIYSAHMQLSPGRLYDNLIAQKVQKEDIPQYKSDRAKKLTVLRLPTIQNAHSKYRDHVGQVLHKKWKPLEPARKLSFSDEMPDVSADSRAHIRSFMHPDWVDVVEDTATEDGNAPMPTYTTNDEKFAAKCWPCMKFRRSCKPPSPPRPDRPDDCGSCIKTKAKCVPPTPEQLKKAILQRGEAQEQRKARRQAARKTPDDATCGPCFAKCRKCAPAPANVYNPNGYCHHCIRARQICVPIKQQHVQQRDNHLKYLKLLKRELRGRQPEVSYNAHPVRKHARRQEPRHLRPRTHFHVRPDQRVAAGDRCLRCASDNSDCNGGKPCERCMRASSDTRIWCTYNRKDGSQIQHLIPNNGEPIEVINDCYYCTKWNHAHFGRVLNCEGFPCTCCVNFSNTHAATHLHLYCVRHIDEQTRERVEIPGVRGSETWEHQLATASTPRDRPTITMVDVITPSESLLPRGTFSVGLQDLDYESDDESTSDVTTFSGANEEMDAAFQRSDEEEEEFLFVDAWYNNVTSSTYDFATAPLPRTFKEAMDGPERDAWLVAFQAEIDSILRANVWYAVPLSDVPEGFLVLDGRWVTKRKLTPDGAVSRYKVRYVIRGFMQRLGLDYNETFSAVIKHSSFLLVFAIVAQLFWWCDVMDVMTAFLHGEIDDLVFLWAPEGFKHLCPQGHVLRLRKALYGLKQSPRVWYTKLRNYLVSLGWLVSDYDPCLFYQPGAGVIAVYVDDLLIATKDKRLMTDIKKALSQEFEMVDLGPCTEYLKMQVEITSGRVHLHQAGYIGQLLRKFDFDTLRTVKTPMEPGTVLRKETHVDATEDFRRHYQELVGSLNYLSARTRYDISLAFGIVSRFMANPNEGHLRAVHRIYAYLKGCPNRGLVYNANAANQVIQGWADANFADCVDTRLSISGWVFTFNGSPISWSSRRQKSIAMSTCEAEYVAASEAAKEAIWLRRVMIELNIVDLPLIKIHIDNKAALALTRNPEHHERSKHIDVRYHFIREKVYDKELETVGVTGKENKADFLTKPLPRPALEKGLARLLE